MHFIENFKGFERVEIDLFNPLTILIGRNGAGKSNVIEAVELLAALVGGVPLHQIADSIENPSATMVLRGGLQACPTHGQDRFALGFDAAIALDGERRQVRYRIEVSVVPTPRIVAESLMLDKGKFLVFESVSEEEQPGGSIKVRYNNFARGGKKPHQLLSSSRSVLSQYEALVAGRASKGILAMVAGLRAYVQSAFVFDPDPKRMRGYARAGEHRLYRDGANLSAALHFLQATDKSLLNGIVAMIRSIPDADIKSIDFEVTKFGDVMLGLLESGTLVPARTLSDGTLRALAVLTALATASAGSRVVVEEFDNGLHPSRVAALIDGIALFAAQDPKPLNVLLTTHNPATLNYLNRDQLASVVIAARTGEHAIPSLISLSDIPCYGELMSRGRLGDLVTSDALTQHLEPGFEEGRRDAVSGWLAGLNS